MATMLSNGTVTTAASTQLRKSGNVRTTDLVAVEQTVTARQETKGNRAETHFLDVEPACVWFKRSGRNCKIASAVRCCSAKRVDDRVGAGSVCKFTHGKHFPLPTDPTLRSGGGRFSVQIHTPNALIVKWRVRACPLYDPAFSSLVCEKLGRKASIVKWRCF